MPHTKRQRPGGDSDDRVHEDDNDNELDSQEGEVAASEDAPSAAEDEQSGSDSGTSSPDTDEEITNLKSSKSKKTLKRKRRATEPSRFGATLQSLLSTDAPSALPLSLKPSIARKKNNEKLELKARKVLQAEKKEKEDKGRIKDTIGGWGGESERALRKVAQRGVVKLFNVIQQSQSAAVVAADEAKANRGTGKPTLPAPSIDKKSKNGKGKNSGISAGPNSEKSVDKDEFFDMIRSGGLVSKA